MINIFKDLKLLFAEDTYKMYLFLVASIFSTFFEVLSLGSIPVFIMIITDLDLVLSKASQIDYLKFILNLEHSQIVIFGAITLMFMFLIKNLYLWLVIFFQGTLIKKLRGELTNNVFKHYVFMSYEKLINRNPATLIRTIDTDIGNTFAYFLAFLVFIREGLILISLSLLLTFTNFFISSVSILTLGLPVIIFYYIYRNILKKKGKLLQLESGKKLKIINQALGSFKELKIMNRENFFLKKFRTTIFNFEKLNLFSYIVATTPRLFLEIAALLSILLISVLLYVSEDNTKSIIPLISLLAVTAIRLIPSLNAITASISTMRFKKPSFDTIIGEIVLLKNSKNFQENKFLNNEDKIKNFEFKNELVLKNVYFNYYNTSKSALENIDFKISKGLSVGIIGRSGAGKSTLVDLILGLLKPQKGEIYVDNNKLLDVTKNWQKQIGYIPQDVYLLDDSIRNNISFGMEKDQVDENLIHKAVKMAQLENLVDGLPDKLDSIVGNRGIKLSGGEKQRIAIGRAIYNNPQILILDEATSALDIENENKILDEIKKNLSDKTTIIISHRNNTVKNCDIIYVMEKGRIIDNGKFDDVMKRNSFLKEKIDSENH